MKNTLLTLFGFILLSTPLAATGEQSGDFTYTTLGGSVILITGYTGPGGAVSIPSTINLHPVVAIGENVFAGKTGLTAVTIPGTVTSIGKNAFGHCTNLTSVTIPGSMTSIDDLAFDYCSGLTRVTISSGVMSIEDYA